MKKNSLKTVKTGLIAAIIAITCCSLWACGKDQGKKKPESGDKTVPEAVKSNENPAEESAGKTVPRVVVSKETMSDKLPHIDQIVFFNVHKHATGDTYFHHQGVRLQDLLDFVGLSEEAESIEVLALDGYKKTFTLDEVKRTYKQSAPVQGLGKEDLGQKCGWVDYGARDYSFEAPLPDAVMMIAFEENGVPLAPASVDESGKLKGEGPVRIVKPQSEPGVPDFPQNGDPACLDKIDPVYHFNAGYDHNSDFCVKGIVAVKVNPMPQGTEDFNWKKMALELIDKGEIVVFGAIKPR